MDMDFDVDDSQAQRDLNLENGGDDDATVLRFLEQETTGPAGSEGLFNELSSTAQQLVSGFRFL